MFGVRHQLRIVKDFAARQHLVPKNHYVGNLCRKKSHKGHISRRLRQISQSDNRPPQAVSLAYAVAMLLYMKDRLESCSGAIYGCDA